MTNQELQILVSMKDEFSSKLDGIDSQLKKSSKGVKTAETDFKKFTKTVGGLATVYASLRFAMSAIKESAEEEQMFIRLAQLTKNSTNATNEQIYALREQAKSLEQVGVVSSENILTLQGQLATYDLNTESITKLTPALLNMATAERGVNVTQQDMISFAEGVSKAIQGQYGALEKRGFIIDDDTKKLIENGTEAQRVEAITGVLNTTYANMNETLAQTSSGSMVQFQNKLKTLKTAIGSALMPTLISLQDGFINLIGIQDGTSESLHGFGEVMFRTANLAKGIFGTLKASVVGMAGYVDVGFSLIKGNTEEAGEKLEKWGEVAQKTWEETGKSFEKWYGDNSEYQKLKKEFDLSKLSSSGGGAGFEDLLGIDKEELEKGLKDVSSKYKDFQTDIDDSLFELGQSHKEASKTFKESIKSIRESMSELNDAYSAGEKSDKQKIAEEIVANQTEIAEMQKKISNTTNVEEIATLQKGIEEKKLALTENATFIQGLEAEITEAKRREGLTDLTRAIEDYTLRRELALTEYNAKMADYQLELKAIKQKQKEEKELYQEKKDFLNKMQDEAKVKYAETLKSNLLNTKASIEKEIEYYRQLAVAIDLARRGANGASFDRAVGKVKSVNDAIISPDGNIITTDPKDYLIATKDPKSLAGGGSVNIYIDNMIGEDVFAEKLGDRIIQNFKMANRF
jgi:hypothetical protein